MSHTVPRSPDLIDAEADALDAEAFRAELEPVRLRTDAAQLRALASALRLRDDALAALAAVQADADRLAAEYDATGPAEADAAARAVEARHLFEQTRDAAATARETGASPAELVNAEIRAEKAALVDEHEQSALALVSSARTAAYQRLTAARDRVRAAKAKAAAAEAAVDDPQQADLDGPTLAKVMLWSWPVRLLAAQSGDPAHKLTPAEKDMAAAYATFFAELAGVSPEQARREGRAEARRAINAELGRVRVTAGGNDLSIGRVVGRL